jgi:hypothetical protein
MKLLNEEKIIKVYHHHPFFFVWRSLKLWMASLPFVMLAVMFSPVLPRMANVIVFLSIFAVFALANAYDILMYYLDTLIITN